MHLVFREMKDWPPLSWVASTTHGVGTVEIRCGKAVERGPHWVVEGVWDGAFSAGAFDRTGTFFGSGVVAHEHEVVFVSSATMVDRLWVYRRGDDLFVSNSLPGILSVSGARLCEDRPDYPVITNNSLEKLSNHSLVAVPIQTGELFLLYFDNLVLNEQGLSVRPKEQNYPRFLRWSDYRTFLSRTARAIGANLADSGRRNPIAQMATISSGYDSPAAAVVAREAGCEDTVTITSARSVLPRSDSGLAVARSLGLNCTSYDGPQPGGGVATELWFWAPLGDAQDSNFVVFDYPLPICLLYTGVYGGRSWSTLRHMHPRTVCFTDTNGLGLSEFRLKAGIIQCPVPFWGFGHVDDLWDLSHAEEMEAWRLHNGYDRPIPRRIVEDAGAPRELFGQKKSATQFEDSFLWPHARGLSNAYRRYLKSRGISAPIVPFWRAYNWLDRNLVLPLEERTGWKALRRLRARSQSSGYLFQWANHELMKAFPVDHE